MIKFGKEKVLESHPNAICKSWLSAKYANKPKLIQRRETLYMVYLNPEDSKYSQGGYSAAQAWDRAAKEIA